MRCPYCKNKLLQKGGDSVRLRTQGPIVFRDGVCQAQCYWCKRMVEIPIELKKGLDLPGERFVLSG